MFKEPTNTAEMIYPLGRTKRIFWPLRRRSLDSNNIAKGKEFPWIYLTDKC